MRTTIYLVRHGQTKWSLLERAQGHRRVPLNKTGRKQAKSVAKRFKNKRIDVIYSSPLLRTKQTAQIIAQGRPVIFEKDLRECYHAKLEGLTYRQIRKKFPSLVDPKKRIDWRPPGKGETIRELQKRSVNIFKKLLQNNRGKQIMIVTHGGVARSMIHWLHGGKLEDIFHTSVLDNAEIMRIVYDGKKFTLTKQK